MATRLHRIVFDADDAPALSAALGDDEGALHKQLNDMDERGNTALHIAVMRGRHGCVRVLLEAGASVRVRNAHGAFAIHEARSYGDRDIIRLLLKERAMQTQHYFEVRSEAISKQLRELDDFYMEMKWDFSSWVPLLSRFCPNDTLTIRKKGACMRIDTTLVGFEGIKWMRGNIGYVYNPHATGNELCIIDYDKKIYERVDGEEPSETKIDERINVLLNFASRYVELLSDDLSFVRVRSGVFGFGSGKSEKVGEYEADMYTIENAKLKTIVRSEHLDPKLVPKDSAPAPTSATPIKNDSSSASLTAENPLKDLLEENNNLEDDNPKAREELLKKLDGKKDDDVDKFVLNARKNALKYKPTLIPPEPSKVTADEYFKAPNPKTPKDAQYIHLGRPMVVNNTTRKLRATLWMSNSFPLFVEQLFPLMEIMAPSNEHFARLRDFIDLRLPRGFPIKIEIPLFGILTARVTFQNYRIDSSFEDSVFDVPEGFQKGEIRFFNE